jgi:hypothetical protein
MVGFVGTVDVDLDTVDIVQVIDLDTLTLHAFCRSHRA